MASIFSQLVREGRIAAVESIKLDAPKTKLFASRLKAMNLPETVLLIADEVDENLFLASRNLGGALVVEPRMQILFRWCIIKKCWLLKALSKC